jgi:DNA processing protein
VSEQTDVCDEHDPRVVAAAITSLPGIGPQRLRLLVDGLGPLEAWRVVRGETAAPDHLAALLRHDGLDRALRRTATRELIERTDDAVRASHIRVLLSSDLEYPASMRGDFAAPAVLFARGNLATFDKRRVGIIGTRAASASGRHFARRLAGDLARNGVAVVSGLARGIDAAAHRGVLDDDEVTGSPIGVVASGLDVVYPREHASLWSRVIERGVLVSESPPGCSPDAFRFPLRNRILAMVSEVLVVVESRATGGSMITVDEAVKRGVTVMAVPGSPHAESSAGTNRLIADGATTVCDVGDVLVALGLDHQHHSTSSDARPRPSARDARVLRELAKQPATLDHLVAALDMPVVEVAISLGRLEVQGWAVSNGGWWEALLPRELPFER